MSTELRSLLESERMERFWAEVERVRVRHAGPLRKAKDPAWFIVDDIFDDLRAIPRRLGEKAVDAENAKQ
jgi:hypothetical protein